MVPKVVVGVLAIAAMALLAGLLFRELPEPPPIVLKLMSVEPAGIYDETNEMWVVTLRMQQIASGPPIYINDTGRSQARVADRWTQVEKVTGTFELYGYHELQFLLPANTDACWVNLKWAHGRLVSGRLWMFAERLTVWPKARLWLFMWCQRNRDFPRYEPSSRWQEFTVELPLPQSSPADSK
jgi:hypothetical protein